VSPALSASGRVTDGYPCRYATVAVCWLQIYQLSFPTTIVVAAYWCYADMTSCLGHRHQTGSYPPLGILTLKVHYFAYSRHLRRFTCQHQLTWKNFVSKSGSGQISRNSRLEPENKRYQPKWTACTGLDYSRWRMTVLPNGHPRSRLPKNRRIPATFFVNGDASDSTRKSVWNQSCTPNWQTHGCRRASHRITRGHASLTLSDDEVSKKLSNLKTHWSVLAFHADINTPSLFSGWWSYRYDVERAGVHSYLSNDPNDWQNLADVRALIKHIPVFWIKVYLRCLPPFFTSLLRLVPLNGFIDIQNSAHPWTRRIDAIDRSYIRSRIQICSGRKCHSGGWKVSNITDYCVVLVSGSKFWVMSLLSNHVARARDRVRSYSILLIHYSRLWLNKINIFF
jgi:hypothetical protein